MMPPNEGEDEGEVIEGWQRSLDRFDRFFWPLFQARGYDKNSAYMFWTLNRLINTLEELPVVFGEDQQRRSDDSDGEPWKRS